MARVNDFNELTYQECRYCLLKEKTNNLISPCLCSGTCKFVHRECLRTWVEKSGKRRCGVCGFCYVRGSWSGWLRPLLGLGAACAYAAWRVAGSRIQGSPLIALADVSLLLTAALAYFVVRPIGSVRSRFLCYRLCKTVDPI